MTTPHEREDPRLHQPVTIAAIDAEGMKAAAELAEAETAWKAAEVRMHDANLRLDNLQRARKAIARILGIQPEDTTERNPS